MLDISLCLCNLFDVFKYIFCEKGPIFLISSFCHVLNVVCFLCNPPASEFYMPTFRNTLFRLHRQVGMKMEQCSKTAYKIQTPGNYAEESIQETSSFH